MSIQYFKLVDVTTKQEYTCTIDIEAKVVTIAFPDQQPSRAIKLYVTNHNLVVGGNYESVGNNVYADPYDPVTGITSITPLTAEESKKLDIR